MALPVIDMIYTPCTKMRHCWWYWNHRGDMSGRKLCTRHQPGLFESEDAWTKKKLCMFTYPVETHQTSDTHPSKVARAKGETSGRWKSKKDVKKNEWFDASPECWLKLKNAKLQTPKRPPPRKRKDYIQNWPDPSRTTRDCASPSLLTKGPATPKKKEKPIYKTGHTPREPPKVVYHRVAGNKKGML